MTLTVVKSGVEKAIVGAPSVIVGGAKKPVKNVWVIQGGVKKLAYSAVPWLNAAGGSAPSNGTDTHTLTLGFTATAGSLLVLVAACPWTITPSGFTQRQLVNHSTVKAGIWTKKAAGGETSITVTHGGVNNMQMEWQVYEFPSTAVFLGSAAGASDTSLTMPTLSGLVAATKTVFSAVARAINGTAGATVSAGSWTVTPDEDRDHLTDKTTADGIWMAVARQASTAITSATPTLSVSTTGSPFVGGIYAKLVFAVAENVATDWLYHASGIAASADPTTVPFGHTAQAGELLYFYAVGGMTQITPSGWTKIAPAVGDMEAALFRKVAAGGESSITVDHNGPRVMGWAFWALPVGSAHHSNSEIVSTADSRTLAGLPGTPVTVLAVYSRVVGHVISAGSASAAWSGGVTELYDLLQLGTGVSGGDGIYHTAAAAQDYTGTTITPAVALTQTGITNTNRYWQVWAVTPP